jgi:hypothetical protein
VDSEITSEPTGFSSGQDLTTGARESGIISKSASGETFVPQSQEKTPEPGTELPNPELNPLLNPTLGRHLGRWAQVYFTSPPEKREEAVGELLRELQRQPSTLPDQPAIQPRPSTIGQDLPALSPAEPVETLRIVDAVVAESPAYQCAACGHLHTSAQRYCGMCGAALEAGPIGDPVSPAASPHRKPILAHTELAGFSPTHESVHGDDSFSNIRWLREKSLSGESASSWHITPRYVPALAAVLAIGILFYAQSRPQPGPSQKGQQAATNAPGSPQSSEAKKPAETPTPASSPSNAPVKSSERSPESGATTQASATPSPAAQSTQAAPAELARNRGPQAPAPANEGQATSRIPTSGAANASPSQAAPPQTATVPNPLNGAAELAMAEDFLSGRTHPRNSEEAAKYLWRAVGKENPSAILLLSNMYLVGDGVPKSCDQARLLLSAAARKGVPQAADKLRDLLRSGCPK